MYRLFLFSLFLAFVPSISIGIAETTSPSAHSSTGAEDRAYWIKVMSKIADPVLEAAGKQQLTASMPTSKKHTPAVPLEAIGRLAAGMASWLELGPDATTEGQLRSHYIKLMVAAIHDGLDPHSPDQFHFNNVCAGQPLVDAAFLASAFLRAPKQLWSNLTPEDQARVVDGFKTVVKIRAYNNNWVLFPATVQAMLWHFTGTADKSYIEKAVNNHLSWYKGDGVYGDGATFHWDYYNSYVVQPLLMEILQVCKEKNDPLGANYPLILKRAQRYAFIQERLISPEGTYPVLGRSSSYRFGAFQTLSLISLEHHLPKRTPPAAVRCGMTALIRRVIESPNTFDERGFLRVGAVGYQPSLAEGYIATSSLYLCTFGLLQLGLPADDAFWTDPATDWTQKRIWSGQSVPIDHAMSEKSNKGGVDGGDLENQDDPENPDPDATANPK